MDWKEFHRAVVREQQRTWRVFRQHVIAMDADDSNNRCIHISEWGLHPMARGSDLLPRYAGHEHLYYFEAPTV